MPTLSSNSPVLVVETRWSWQRVVLLVAQYVICVTIPFLIPYWPIAGRLLLSSGVLVLLTMGYYHAGWWGSRRIIRVIWQQSGSWIVQRVADGAASQSSWQLLGRSWITPWLMVLRWRGDQSTAQLFVLRGEIPATVWQQLQLRLKLEGGHVGVSTLTEV